MRAPKGHLANGPVIIPVAPSVPATNSRSFAVKAIYHRNDPILEDEAPLWPGAVKMDLHISAGVLWDQLESAGIQDIVGVYNHTSY